MTAIDAFIIDTAVRVYDIPVAVVRTKADQDMPKLIKKAMQQRVSTPSQAPRRNAQRKVRAGAIAKQQGADHRHTPVNEKRETAQDRKSALATIVKQHEADVKGKSLFCYFM